MPALLTEDAGGAHLVWSEQLSEIMLVHRLGQVRHVEVGVVLIGEGLQLRVERLLFGISTWSSNEAATTLALAKLTS